VGLLLSSTTSTGLVTADTPSNPWFSWTYVSNHTDDLTEALRQHVQLTFVPVIAALILCIPLALAVRRWPRLEGPLLGLAGAVYTIPSLVLITALVPAFGLTARTVEIALTVYALLIVLRNLITGLAGVPADVRDAALGMGFGPIRMLTRVDVPLALPSIFAGLRVATVSTIGLVTIGSLVGYGGFGNLINQGFQNNFYHAEIMTATLACVILALVCDALFVLLQTALTPWTWRTRGRSRNLLRRRGELVAAGADTGAETPGASL
jgi:osmoprotectant transport system permease protein